MAKLLDASGMAGDGGAWSAAKNAVRSVAVPFPDLIQPELGAYQSAVKTPGDFAAFWEASLAEARSVGGAVSIVPAETTLRPSKPST